VKSRFERVPPPSTESHIHGVANAIAIAGATGVTRSRVAVGKRYSWPHRLFIGFFVADAALRCVLVVSCRRTWPEELAMARVPRHGSFEATLAFYDPRPSANTAESLHGSGSFAKYAAVWLKLRLDFVGRFTGVTQNWVMFSPNASRSRIVHRARLEFEDGAETVLRGTMEPRDFTRYSHWWDDRVLHGELRLGKTEFGRCSWARQLAATQVHSERGAKLRKIVLYEANYQLPEAGDDAALYWRALNRRRLLGRPVWEYDVASKEGRPIVPKADESLEDAP